MAMSTTCSPTVIGPMPKLRPSDWEDIWPRSGIWQKTLGFGTAGEQIRACGSDFMIRFLVTEAGHSMRQTLCGLQASLPHTETGIQETQTTLVVWNTSLQLWGLPRLVLVIGMMPQIHPAPIFTE